MQTKRPLNSQAEHFDMLPFIGLLMCVLGVLLFVTLSVAALAMGPNVKEGWLPLDDVNTRKTPILVEWDGMKAVIHRENETASVLVYSTNKSTITPEFTAFVTEMERKRKSDYVLFAVRPSGFRNFQMLADEFRNKRIDIGYEPITQDRAVRLIRRQP